MAKHMGRTQKQCLDIFLFIKRVHCIPHFIIRIIDDNIRQYRIYKQNCACDDKTSEQYSDSSFHLYNHAFPKFILQVIAKRPLLKKQLCRRECSESGSAVIVCFVQRKLSKILFRNSLIHSPKTGNK